MTRFKKRRLIIALLLISVISISAVVALYASKFHCDFHLFSNNRISSNSVQTNKENNIIKITMLLTDGPIPVSSVYIFDIHSRVLSMGSTIETANRIPHLTFKLTDDDYLKLMNVIEKYHIWNIKPEYDKEEAEYYKYLRCLDCGAIYHPAITMYLEKDIQVEERSFGAFEDWTEFQPFYDEYSNEISRIIHNNIIWFTEYHSYGNDNIVLFLNDIYSPDKKYNLYMYRDESGAVISLANITIKANYNYSIDLHAPTGLPDLDDYKIIEIEERLNDINFNGNGVSYLYIFNNNGDNTCIDCPKGVSSDIYFKYDKAASKLYLEHYYEGNAEKRLTFMTLLYFQGKFTKL